MPFVSSHFTTDRGPQCPNSLFLLLSLSACCTFDSSIFVTKVPNPWENQPHEGDPSSLRTTRD